MQSAQAWEIARVRGRLVADPRHVDPHFERAYDWMIRQMHQRMGPPPMGATHPVWAWVQPPHDWLEPPDPTSGVQAQPEEDQVLLTFELAPATHLPSDFDLWHFVINYSYPPATDAEEEAFERRLEALGPHASNARPLPEPHHGELVATWDRIFDLDWCVRTSGVPLRKRNIQTTLWELPLDAVVRVEALP